MITFRYGENHENVDEKDQMEEIVRPGSSESFLKNPQLGRKYHYITESFAMRPPAKMHKAVYEEFLDFRTTKLVTTSYLPWKDQTGIYIYIYI